MEVVGSVAPDEVPVNNQVRETGVWSGLATRTIADHENGRVTVVRLKDDAELKALRNNLSQTFRKRGYRLRPVVVRQADGIRVFLELRLREPVTGPEPPPAQNNQRPIAEAWSAR